MFLLAGLGNPGAQYAETRHNAGFLAVDAIAARYRFPSFVSRHHAEASKGSIAGEEVLLLKPQTFMNRSGLAVGEAMRFYKIPLANVWVLHDDLDLAPGKLRLKRGGGDGGHNGLKSIDAQIGKEYGRLRIGIGRPEHATEVTSYVLGTFRAEEEDIFAPFFARLAEAIPALFEGREDILMNKVAQGAASNKERKE